LPADLAQSLEQVPPASCTRRRRTQRFTIALALPSLMRGARRAQLAHGARTAGGNEKLMLLAAQQSPLAYVTGDVRL
jgi:hypothetical protein